MKKTLWKIFMWDHLCQVMFVGSVIPSILAWVHGKATVYTGFIVGWNLGCAAYWQFYISQRKRTDEWRKLAIQKAVPDFDKMFHVAKNLVEARIKQANIDPDKN